MSLDNLRGRTYRRGDPASPSWYQTAVHTAPDLLVQAADAADVHHAVTYAARNGIPLAVRATGHGAISLTEAMLVSTTELQDVHIDPHRRLARVGAGVTWGSVVQQAARHGLAPLSGSAPTVGVVGYTLGGGIGPLTRPYGYAADHVTTLEVVTADGQPRQVSAQSHSDLYWALRGGGGSLAIVTALQFELVPVDRVVSGALVFEPNRFPEIVERYREWTTSLPHEMTTSLSFMTFPDTPAMPEHIRGCRSLRIFVTCTDADSCASAIGALRAWRPLEDTLRLMPYSDCSEVFAEPGDPHGYQGDAVTSTTLDVTATAAIMRQMEAETENCIFLQIHQLGGVAGRPARYENAVGHRNARYIVRVTSPVLEAAPAGLANLQSTLIENLAHGSTHRAPNFLFGDNLRPCTARSCYEPEVYRRLTAIKQHYDPANLFRVGRVLPPAGDSTSTARDVSL